MSASKADKSSASKADNIKTNAQGEEEAKDLPPEEFTDFLNTLDSDT